jgi:carbon monoxide dehydrogenase subunit G
MSRFTYSIHVNAPPEAVFDVLTDPQRIPDWHAGVEIKDVTGPPAVGAAFTIVGTMLGRKQEHRRTITQFERPRVFAMEGPGGGMLARFEATADGTDLVTDEKFDMPFGLVGEWATEHLFRRWAMSEIDKSLKSLKALVEAEAPAHA